MMLFPAMASLEPRHEYLHPGKNGIETSVAIMSVASAFKGAKRTMEQETVKEIFRRLNAGGVRYALIGGLAYGEYAPPRATEDVDLIVLSEDVVKMRALFPRCYVRETAIAGIYDFQGTRMDVQPAKRRAQAAAAAQDIASIATGLLAMAYTAEDAARYRAAVAWLNEALDLVGMGDRKYLEGGEATGAT